MGSVSFDFAPLRIRCDPFHPAASVQQFIIARVVGAELQMSNAGVLEVSRFCEVPRETLKGERAAIEVFWRRGYSGAAISDLTAATGLSRSSLYQRFHDKDGLFQEALEGYTQRVLLRMNSAKADTARGRLKALLRAFFPDRSRPAGCLSLALTRHANGPSFDCR